MTKKVSFNETRRIHKECPVCETEKELAYGEIKETLKIRGVDIKVVSRINHCIDGDHYFYDLEDEEAKFQFAYREYKKLKGFLQAEEIKAIRQQYGLSQKNFARLFNWGDITIQRYESGAIQDDVHNDVLMFIREFDNFKKYFITKKNFISPDIAAKIEEKINAIEKERSIGVLERIFTIKRKGYPMLIQSTVELRYSIHNETLQSCSNNNELALAA